MSQKTFPVYDHPSYTTRQSFILYNAAASAISLQKFAAFANMYLYSATMIPYAIGTSTYSSTTSAQQISLFIVTNTSTSSTVALATATFGPYIPGGGFSPAQIATPTVAVFNTATAPGGFGGYYVPAGAIVYSSSGTDASANIVTILDYQLAPLAPVTA
jgi:hypothetical protein